MSAAVVLAGIVGQIGCQESTNPEPARVWPAADLVLLNGNIVTVDDRVPRAQAIAIIGDRIVSVGSNEDVSVHLQDTTRVIDLTGLTAIPGFIEGHGHFTSFGESLMTLDFRYAESFAAIVDMVANAADSTPAGEWIIGRGWHQDKWAVKETVLVEGLPLHDTLSAATSDHPVMLIHTSGHAVFVNQHAMDLIGINPETAAPEGGEGFQNNRFL